MKRSNNLYDKIFITNLPSFYKINLYNEVAKKIKVAVIFTGDDFKTRNDDFFSGDICFDTIYYKKRTYFYRIFFTIKLLFNLRSKEYVLGGWDSLPLWIFAIFSRGSKLSVIVESSYLESRTTGLKGVIKKIFINKIRNSAYVSGEGQKILVEKLGFQGKIIKTKGVGIFNYIKQPTYVPRKEVKNFIFVGRLVEVKNLELLIRVFNKLPMLTLNIIGFGHLEDSLKAIANKNIIFHGQVDNKLLPNYYQANDVFILASKSEVWGLVVEEALNNGLPVIVSSMVGCAPEIVNEKNGLIFKFDSEDDLLAKIEKIRDINFYNSLRKEISFIDFKKIEDSQIKCYL